MNNKLTRLPCRGCLKGCKNYNTCQGKPWKLTAGKAKLTNSNRHQPALHKLGPPLLLLDSAVHSTEY